MKNIQKAIQIEKEYVEHRLRGEQPYTLIDKLRECGFGNLDEYFHDKREHDIHQLDFEVIDTSPDMGASITAASVRAGRPIIVFGNTDSVYVFHGTEDYNEEYCKENHISVINYHANGGNIVISGGDLSIGLCFPCGDVSSQYILRHLAGILSEHIDGVSVDSNDILIDGKKVAGSAVFQDSTSVGIVVHFSFSDKSELIASICNEIRKPIGYIDGITREQLRREVVSWLQKH